MTMSKPSAVAFYWFRRDLRLEDNVGLHHALRSGLPVVPIFIFDKKILDRLENPKDLRVQFIHQELNKLSTMLRSFGSELVMRYGHPEAIWKQLLTEYHVQAVYTNRDYEPYARKRDALIESLLKKNDIEFHSFKDQVIFDTNEVVKEDGNPYVVYTPFSRKWRSMLTDVMLEPLPCSPYFDKFQKCSPAAFPSLASMGFESMEFDYPPRLVDTNLLSEYSKMRDLPAKGQTSKLGIHLRFGTLSIRALTKVALNHSDSWLNELIWRNFYQVIIWHFPDRIDHAFKADYDRIQWRNNPEEFDAWCEGCTGYPIVDAGMRELNTTGFMHNRVRMIVASFLTKHLLIDWRWGEAYFASKLLDFDLAANNGGWQWAAGSGCDAAPYFRVFNPELQSQKFDPKKEYIARWVTEYGTKNYPKPILDHKVARERALSTYKDALRRPI